MSERGKLYGIGVGPGDPELLTLKAVRLLRECDVVAAPDGERAAYQIARRFAEGKPTRFFSFPMTRDQAAAAENHQKAADALCALLDEGKTVAFLTLGDPSVYSTYWYIHRRLAARGYAAEMIPGVPSFCAAAAALGRALCEGSEALHILPASHGQAIPQSGNLVLMKAGKSILETCSELKRIGRLQDAALVERCGMEGERVLADLSELDEPTGYFSVILVKNRADAVDSL